MHIIYSLPIPYTFTIVHAELRKNLIKSMGASSDVPFIKLNHMYSNIP